MKHCTDMNVIFYHNADVCVDGDGLNELVVAYTDRVVRAYRWWSADDSNAAGKAQTTAGSLVAVDRWLLTGQVLADSSYMLPLKHFVK